MICTKNIDFFLAKSSLDTTKMDTAETDTTETDTKTDTVEREITEMEHEELFRRYLFAVIFELVVQRLRTGTHKKHLFMTDISVREFRRLDGAYKKRFCDGVRAHRRLRGCDPRLINVWVSDEEIIWMFKKYCWRFLHELCAIITKTSNARADLTADNITTDEIVDFITTGRDLTL